MSRRIRVIVAMALLSAGLARADRPAPEIEHPAVADVVLELPPGEDAAGLQRLVAIKVGQPLDRRTVRRTVQLLYGAGRFANVVAHVRAARDRPGQVVVVLECLPRRLVASLHVVNRALRPVLDEASVRRAAALEIGDELWAGRIEEAAQRVREALARRGYRAAEVHGRATGERQAAVELVVEEGRPTRIGAVEFGPAAHRIAGRLADGLATQPGAILDLDTLDDDVRSVRAHLRRERFLRARVGTPAVTVEGDRARVEIPVEPGPRFEFRFPGAAAFRPAELRDQLGLESEQTIDATSIEAAAGRLRSFYQARGYATARITAGELEQGSRIAVVFRVDEGRRYRVRSVRFTGVTQRGEAWARARFEDALLAVAPVGAAPDGDAERLSKASGSPSAIHSRAVSDPREVWSPQVWDAAALRLVELYRADGYLDAAYERTRIALDASTGTVDVELELKEGVQTRVASIAFEGNRAVPTGDIERQRRIAPGDPLGYGAVEATRAAVLTLYGRRGFLYARVTDAEELSTDHATAAVRFRIEEGPQVRVGSVVVTGARWTREYVVRDALALRPGDVYDPDAASRSQAALLRLGVFRSVGLRLSDPDQPEETKDVTVDLAERPWRTLAPGVGFSLANGPRAFVELVQPNLFGRALELSSRAKVNYPLDTFRPDLVGKSFMERIEGRGDVGLHDPRARIFGTQVGARVDAILERLHRRAYDLGRASTILGIDLPATSRVTLSLQYELEFDHIQQSDVQRQAQAAFALTRADVERLRFPIGFTTLQSLRPVLTLDFRDHAFHPRRGLLASGTIDYVHSIGGSTDGYLWGLIQGSDVFTHMLKLSGSMTGYVPIASQSVLAVSFRAGRVVPLQSSSQTIGPKRFFLGGAATMRGYEEDEMIPQDRRNAYLDQIRTCATSISGLGCSTTAQQVAQGQAVVSEGGEAFVLAKAELRIPLRDSVEAGVFADAGNLWLDPAQLSFTDLRLNVGIGLRFSSPIGPAVLDFGMNVSPDRRLGERVFAPHFSIGLF